MAIVATSLRVDLFISRSLELQIQGSLLELNFSGNIKLSIKTYLKVSKKKMPLAMYISESYNIDNIALIYTM